MHIAAKAYSGRVRRFIDAHLRAPLQRRFGRNTGADDLRLRLRQLREAAFCAADDASSVEDAPVRAVSLVARATSEPEIYRVRSGIPSILDDTPPNSESAADGTVITAIFVAPRAPVGEAAVEHRLDVL